MKIITWNVNGIRAVMNKGFMDFFNKENADIYCLQEIKVHNGDIPSDLKQIGALNGYRSYWNGAEKKGYSGVGIITKKLPINVYYGMDDSRFDAEGRVLTLEFDEFFLVNIYVMNSKRGLLRLEERMDFDESLRLYLKSLDEKKPVIFCGDLNVAHKEIDLANPKSNRKNAGFTDEERDSFSKTLDLGFVDVFRKFDQSPDKYTWWSYMFNAREKNVGWRIDYFIVSDRVLKKINDCKILPEIFGSDHCPVILECDLN